jgi:hypothetical protein
VEFLIAQGGPRKFVQFLEEGMQSQRWETAIQHVYEYETLGQLQTRWNQWIADGRGAVDSYVANPGAPRTPAAATLASSAQTISVPSLDAVAAVRQADELQEGASVALVSATTSSPATADPATSSLANVSPAPPAGALAVVQASATTAGVAAAAGTADAGFYRQRLESQLRDIVRVTPGQPTAPVQEQPTARTAGLDRNSMNAVALEPIAQRTTSRPQPAQATPLRVLR